MPERVASRVEARALCQDLKEALDELELIEAEIRDTLADARDAHDEACEGDGVWSLSTLGDIVGGAAIVGGCLSTPFGWVACGAGVVAGGGTIIIAESQRDSGGGPDCERAEGLVSRAEDAYDRVRQLSSDNFLSWNDCFRHHYAWWRDT